VLAVAAALIVAVAVTSKSYRIPGSSMESTIHCPEPASGCLGDDADRVLVSRVVYEVNDPERGDIVAYELPARGATACGGQPDATYLHRIVGLPGERVRIRAGVVFVNGRRLDEPYVDRQRLGGLSMSQRVIPSGRFMVLGDNRNASCDSRVWGFLERDRIVGPKIATYWPLDRISVSFR
jgi:signal peptidase I